MKTHSLSLLTTTCILALTACSNGSKSGVDAYLSSQANTELKEAHAKSEEAQQALQAAEQKTKEAVAAKEAAEKEATSAKSTLEGLAQKLQAAEAAQAEAEKKAEEALLAKKALEDHIESEKRAEAQRIEQNKTELKKGFSNQPLESVTTSKVDEWTGLTKTETTHFSYVNGKLLAVEGKNLTDNPLVNEHRDLNQLIVDGTTVTLFSKAEIDARKAGSHETYNIKALTNADLPEGSTQNLTGYVGSLPKVRYDSEFAQMRYGYVTLDGKTTLFVQGHLTPEATVETSRYDHMYYGTELGARGTDLDPMPTKGVFEYVGSAFYGKDGAYTELSSSAVADFNDKKVKVTVSDSQGEKAVFGGMISGNTFTGNYNDIVTKGAFYGDEAQDIGGMFYRTAGSEQDYHGVFGATKAGCTWRGCPELAENTLKDFSVTE